ncbi:hypothetical protein EJ04DRAFT_512426 [Polyplosphaeria fusca]|uniref:Uncharacterized protein n=1 Tax=Polyplosphaeria fusca TaxID=682080 RepID=A0A9P4R155_9PLEO|nr:hypothetical protein EJ04DRAFT_512426 [Polyplosphaeria fusca]
MRSHDLPHACPSFDRASKSGAPLNQATLPGAKSPSTDGDGNGDGDDDDDDGPPTARGGGGGGGDFPDNPLRRIVPYCHSG